MRKNRKTIVVLCAILIFCSIVGIVLYQNTFSVQYKERQSLQIDGYHKAITDCVKKGKITLYCETSLALSKQQELQLFEILEVDCEHLESKTGLNPVVKVALIADDYILSANNGFVYNNGMVICNLYALENKTYRTALVGAYLQTTEKWKQVAAAEYFFYENAATDVIELQDFYEHNEDDLFLTLFQAYFSKAFTSDVVIDMANKTAVSLGKYIIDNYPLNDFLQASLTDYRNEWILNNNITVAFNVSFDLSWLNGAVYSEKFLQYPLVIETTNRIYNLDSIYSARDSAAFNSPQTIIEHLSNGNKGVREALTYMQLNLTDENLLNNIRNSYDGKIEYFISSQEIGTEADVDKRKVYLKDPSEFIHETMHVLTLKKNCVDGAWLAEGVAEFFSREISDIKADIDYRMYNSFSMADVSGDLKSFVQDVKVKYESFGGDFSGIDTFKFYLLEQSIAYVTLTKPEYKQKIKFPYATTRVKDMKYLSSSDKGNELTYPESYLFVRYLINKYGIDKVLSCCFDYDLMQTFGATYEKIYSDFVKAINDD